MGLIESYEPLKIKVEHFLQLVQKEKSEIFEAWKGFAALLLV